MTMEMKMTTMRDLSYHYSSAFCLSLLLTARYAHAHYGVTRSLGLLSLSFLVSFLEFLRA